MEPYTFTHSIQRIGELGGFKSAKEFIADVIVTDEKGNETTEGKRTGDSQVLGAEFVLGNKVSVCLALQGNSVMWLEPGDTLEVFSTEKERNPTGFYVKAAGISPKRYDHRRFMPFRKVSEIQIKLN